MNKHDLIVLINSTLNTIDDGLGRNIRSEEYRKRLIGIFEDLMLEFEEYSKIEPIECGRLVIKRWIPLLNFMIKVENSEERRVKYHNALENGYKMAARCSLEHFIQYMEWWEKKEDKLLEPRYEILKSYIYYLNRMCFDPSFEGMIVNLPSGYGKSRVCRYYEAFRLGLDPTGTFLALCSNDDLIKGQSRSVIDIIKSERYGNVFPHLKYSKEDKDFFLKETDGEWKLRDCKLISSYYAKTVKSNVVGIRASLSIDIDDLYSDPDDALDDVQNKKYYNNFVTVWRKRYIQNKKAQILITGTLWSPTDFLAKVTALWENESKFVPDPKFKYTKISQDGNKVIIKVPALDYETGESTCPALKSTEDLLKEKQSMSTYLWETNFQQNPTSPEGLYFDWTNLKTYEILPPRETRECFAALDPSRTGNDYVSMPIFNKIGDEHYLVDAVFDNKAITTLMDTIVNAIIRNNVTLLVVETNTNTSLPDMIYAKCEEKGYYTLKIIEKYNTGKKEERINTFKDIILRKLVFPDKIMYGLGTPIGKAMDQMTSFSFNYPNKHDDMIDSVSMYADQIVEENGLEMKVEVIKKPF